MPDTQYADSADHIDNPGRSGEDEFTVSLQNTLEQTGELRKLRASIRATIMNVIRGNESGPMTRVRCRSAAIDLCHSLVVDFVQWAGYHYSEEMFTTESGAKATTDRNELAGQLGAAFYRKAEAGDGNEDVPVLLAMVVERMQFDNVAT